jgi:hypothetical protein
MHIIVINTANGYRYLMLKEPASLPLVEGQLVAHYANWISFISPDNLEVTDVKLCRIGAKRALHHILDIERIDADGNDND